MNPSPSIFCGSIAALPTPFVRDRLDLPTLNHLIERQIEGRSSGLVIAGSTGEGITLSVRERLGLFEYAAGAAGGRIPVIASIGCSATADAMRLTEAAEGTGVQAIMLTTPAYNRPNALGLERHFAAVASATTLPVALYNVPARTGVDLLPESVARIQEQCANVVAIKEASNSLERLEELLALDGLSVLTGDDHLILEALALGVAGVVGVLANLVPKQIAQVVRQHASHGAECQSIMAQLAPLVAALHADTNPAPVKHALECLGVMQSDLRLPLVPVSGTIAKQIHAALVQAQLLEF